MKLLTKLVLYSILFTPFSLLADPPVDTQDQLLVSIEQNLRDIDYKFGDYELTPLKNDLEECNRLLELVKSYTNNGNDSLYQLNYDNLLVTYDKVKYAHFIIQELEWEQKTQMQNYFTKWDHIYYLKNRVDKLYTKQENIKNVALNVESEFTNYRKRNLYLAWDGIYEKFSKRLKRVSSCNYPGRIVLLENMQILLEVAEKLLYEPDTKALEKSLRKVKDPKRIIELLTVNPKASDLNNIDLSHLEE